MNREEAKIKILGEFRAWSDLPENNSKVMNGHTAMIFFNKISAEKSWLLDFKAKGDKWQDVKGWLQNAGFIEA